MPRRTSQNTSFTSFKKLASIFIVLAVVLLVIIVYFSFSKATILLNVDNEPKTFSFDLTVSPTSTEGDLVGEIMTDKLEVSQKFDVKNFNEQPAVATGKIRVVNQHTQNQPLVRTTRFLSPEGILFRLSSNILVPAGKEVVTEVYADGTGAEYNLAPTRFTIPGLSASLQTKIYGISDTAMTGGIKKVGVLKQEDLTVAEAEFSAQLNSLVKEAIRKKITEDSGTLLVKAKVLNQQNSNKVGEEVGGFTINAQVAVEAVLLNEEKLIAAAQDTYKEKLGSGLQVIDWQMDNFKYNVTSFDLINKTAVISIELTANVQGGFDLEKFDKKEIIGFDRRGVEYYFSQYPSVRQVEVKFWPFWVSSVPTLVDRIKIEVK